MKKYGFLALIATLFAACAAQEKTTDSAASEPTTISEDEASESYRTASVDSKEKRTIGLEQVVRSNNAFALDMHRALPQTNMITSPYSVSTLLAALNAGAAKGTQKQIGAALHLGPEPPAARKYRDLSDHLSGRENDADRGLAFRLRVSNGLWAAKDYEFLTEFLRTASNEFLMKPATLDFKGNPEAARKSINQSISDATADRIPELIPSGTIQKDTRLILTNAVYFNAPWSYPFPKAATKTGAFVKVNQEHLQVPYMHLTENLRYVKKDGFQALELPYVGEQVVALLILPDAGSYSDVDAGLTQSQLEHIQNSLAYQRVNVRLPRFELRTNLELTNTLKTMGLTEMFDAQKADFSGISDEPLFVGAVLHDGFIRVDEAGTEAAAATAMMAFGGGASPATADFHAERPFTMLIMDKPTGQILFVSRVLEP